MKAKLPTVWFAGSAALLLLALAALPASLLAQSITTTVVGTDGPWSVSQNPSYSYDNYGVTGTDVVSSASGIAFSSGDILTVGYASGCVNTGSPFSHCVDADGQTADQTDQDPQVRNQTTGFPSQYIDSSMDPIYLSELVGAFANNGVIVGAPFVLSDSWSGVIPNGANELLLGVNDAVGAAYTDNSGSWNLSVTEGIPSAPTTIATASLPNDAGGMALNPGLNRLYVSGPYKTYVINASNVTYPVLTYVGGGGPDVDLHTNNFWTADGVYNGTTNNLIAAYSGVSGCPIGTAVDSDNRIGYVISQCGDYNDPVFAFNADTYDLKGSIGSGGVNGGPASVNPSTEVLFWNPSSGPKEWDLAASPSTVYSAPYVVGGVDPVTNIGYAVNGSSLYAMDLSNPADVNVTHTITLNGTATSGQIGVNPGLDHFYVGETVSSSGYLYIYDGATNTVTGSVDFGTNIYPQDVVVDSSRNLVYVEAANTSTNAKLLYVVEDTPSSASHEIQSAISFIQNDLSTVLNHGQDHSLVKQLKDALKLACEGKINGAVGNLESFIGEVQDLEGSGALNPSQAETLIGAASQAIDALQSGGPLGCS